MCPYFKFYFTNVHKQRKTHHKDRNMVTLIFLYQIKLLERIFELFLWPLKMFLLDLLCYWGCYSENFKKSSIHGSRQQSNFIFHALQVRYPRFIVSAVSVPFSLSCISLCNRYHAQHILLGKCAPRCARDLLEHSPYPQVSKNMVIAPTCIWSWERFPG